MVQRWVISLAVGICSLMLLASGAWAAEPSVAPSKDSLLAAWVSTLKASDTTKKIEATAEKNVYQFETDLFPYKGKVTVLNTVIEKRSNSYDYEAPDDATYVGSVEVKLNDAPKEFWYDLTYSHEAWLRFSRLYYDAEDKTWYSAEAWGEHQKSKRAVSSSQCAAKPSSWLNNKFITDVLLPWIPLVVIIIIVSLFSKRSVRRQNDYFKKYDTSLERQEYAVKLAEDNMVLQKEQNALLKELLDELKKG